MKIVFVVIAGLISVILTEVIAITWMTMAPASIDLVGNFFLLTVLPSITIVVLIAALALWKLFAADPVRLASIYTGIYVIAQAFGLSQMGNPPVNLVYYAAIVLSVCGVVLGLFHRFAWSDRS